MAESVKVTENITVLPDTSADVDGFGKFVTFKTTGGSFTVLLSTAGAIAHGVLCENVVVGGEAAMIPINGNIASVLVGAGGLTQGQNVSVGTGGLAVASTSTDVIIGTALEAASEGDYAKVLLMYQGVVS